MPTIAQRQPAPTLIRDSLPLPSTFPDLPDDVMKRFPSLADWQANKDKWWKRAYVALQDSNGSVSQTVTNTRASQDSLRAQFISTSGTFTASLATEITIRANADAALAARATNLEASVDTPTTGLLARVTTIETTYATTTSVTAAISTAISSEITNRDAAISSSASALTSAYTAADSTLNTALSGSISSLTATVTSNNSTLTTAISTEASARAAADGFLEGKYTLTVAAGDVVTGMNFTSSTGAGTDISDVTFVAANFKIYNGTTGVTMFNVSGSTVQLAGTLTVSTGGKVYIGTGDFANTNTAFYVDSAGQFSLKDQFTWDGTTATLKGTIDIGSSFAHFKVDSTQAFFGYTGARGNRLFFTGSSLKLSVFDSTTTEYPIFSSVIVAGDSAPVGQNYAYALTSWYYDSNITSGGNPYKVVEIGGNYAGGRIVLGDGSTDIVIDHLSSGGLSFSGATSFYSFDKQVSAASFSGSGASLTSIPISALATDPTNASNISSGTLNVGRLPADIDVTGYVRAGTGYAGRAGVGGLTSNLINISWDGTFNHIWTDATDVGAVVVAGAYVATPATSAGYALMKTSDGTLRKFMIGT